ncbi:hypothetical protein [Pseudomonas simiae]|uniref:Uncharacterized protein n=1 Tax=Pseudomonas simiae TaxID=321846 RepID=A0ABS9FZ15_9PSED|nr:hypothetical protein [Pseudomonas simiae]MCF5186276.1 hypothetical protein [Pseudomonas simiae]MCF5287426.1 hypothetical protein [Pseudomonas simiae]MCF5318017.1 hypothetical protein [Pseudomonas simiae]MCF5334349.1 hypothetical protein [Pseudomonas simiae]MCF5342558.1 hypothetical protein [Pseudomonas simiae]
MEEDFMGMQKGKIYLFDHPTLQGYRIIDGWVKLHGKDVGVVGKNNGALRFYPEGVIDFHAHLPDLPKEWKKSIIIHGLTAVLPSEELIALYEMHSERPSSIEKRRAEALRYEAAFNDMANGIFDEVKGYLNENHDPAAVKRFYSLLISFKSRMGRDASSPSLNGFLLGLQAASILDEKQSQLISGKINQLHELGGIYSDYISNR